jgi:hypothetical protein
MLDPDATYIVCIPASWRASPVPGAETRECSECADDVWLAPSGQAIVDREKAAIVCIVCAATAKGEHSVIGPNPEQVREILAALMAS